MGVPESDVLSHAKTPWAYNTSGTATGELVASMRHLTGFIHSYINGPLKRVYDANGKVDMRYTAAFAGSALLASYLSMQYRAIKDGKDPAEMDHLQSWVDMATNFPGLGLMFNTVSYKDEGLAARFSPAVLKAGVDVANLGIQTVRAAVSDESSLGRVGTQFLRSYAPPAKLPGVGLAFQRMFIDDLQARFDPGAHQSFRNKARGAMEDYGQGYWWAPGESSPSRSVDFGNALGNGQ